MIRTLRFRSLAPLVVLVLGLCVGDGAASAAGEPVPSGTERIPYVKRVLPNGFTLIVHEDHALPIAAVNLWYRVGAKDEPPGRSGFAHLFEHLMFMGTARVPTGQFDLIMEGGGGSNNASTSLDRTNYFSSGPAHLLPTLLWLDADRLQDLGRAMTGEKLETQRQVVLNEKRQSYDNQPYGLSELAIYEAMFPEGHPYRFDVIGRDDDIRHATVEDVTRFFDTYYAPNNVALVVAGDVDPTQVTEWAERWFGTLPPRPAPPRRVVEPARLSGVVRRTMTDAVSLARTTMVWHSPPQYAPGDAEMDLVAAVLSDGKDSRLFRRLVHGDALATDVSAYQESNVLQSLFRIAVTARPDADLDRIEAIVDEEVARLRREGPTEAEIARARARIETRTVEALQSVEARADVLNAYEFAFGEPDSLARDLGRYRQATPAMVKDWAGRILDPERRLVLRVLPDPRDQRPTDLEPKPFEPPMPEAFTLENGLRVLHVDRPTLPFVAIDLVIPAGSADDPPGRAGLASLAAHMLDEGAGDLSALDFATALEALGTSLATGADRDGTQVSLRVLRSSFEKALALFADAVRRPRMTPEDFERVRALRVADLRQEDDDPVALARRIALEAYFGKEHPYAHRPEGRVAEVSSLPLEAVRAFHRQRYRPDTATLLVAGDVRRADLEPLLARAFGDWRAEGPPPPRTAIPLAEPKDLRVLVVDRPGAEQTAIRYVAPGVRWADDDRVRLDLLNLLFGAGFSSRLNYNLREAHGWTYGASSASYALRDGGVLIASAPVRTDATGSALAEFAKEFASIRSGNVTDEEARKARSSWRSEQVGSFQSLSGLLGQYAARVLQGVPLVTLRKDFDVATGTTTEALNDLARRRVAFDRGVLVLVGDRAEILPQIAPLGLPPPLEVDPAKP